MPLSPNLPKYFVPPERKEEFLDFQTTLLAFFEQFLASSPLGFCFFNRSLRYTCVNESLAQMNGYAPEQYLGRTVSDLLPAISQKVELALQNVIATSRPVIGLEVALPKENGELHTLQSFYPVMAKEGLMGIGCLIIDITERKQMEAELEAAARELSRSNEDLQRFACTASHDLKEPLRVVSNYIQLLERRSKEQLDEESQTYLGVVKDGTKRMGALIDDLLQYSSASNATPEFVTESLERILSTVILNLDIALSESHAVVTHGPLPQVYCDPIQLITLFQNLISNAIKYQRESPPKIHISAKLWGQDWVFSVQDNGIGLDMKFAENIFDLFRRLHSRSEYSGSGIGLATCKKIIERHRGRIWVESQLGVGSTFYFSLPQ